MRPFYILAVFFLMLILLASCGSGDGADDAGARCSLNSDCAGGALCLEGQCVVQCREDRDCSIGQVCTALGCESVGGGSGADATGASVSTTDDVVGPPGGDSGGADTDCEGGCPGVMICTWSGCQSPDEIEDFSPAPDDEVLDQWEELGEFGSDYDGRRLPFGDTTARYTFCGVQGYSNLGNEKTARVPMDTFGYPYHCTEYALRFICEVYNVADCRRLGRNNQGTGHAGQWYADTARHYVLTRLERHPNGGSVRPQPGDILAGSTDEYGHVAIIREVGEDFVAVIEQNFSQSEQDAYRTWGMSTTNGQYRVMGTPDLEWQGWMRVPGASPACADPRPSLVSPASAATFETGQAIEFRWAPGVATASHSLRIRNLDTDRIVFDSPVGTATTYSISDLSAGSYRWTVYYRSSGCAEPDSEGRCSADARSFTVVAGATPCDANACRSASRTSGSICDGNAVVSCGSVSGCEVELGRSNCPSGQSCSESGSAATCTTTCTPNASRQCSGNAVYNYDSCGQRGSLVQQCGSGQSCSNGQCVSSATITANYTTTLSPGGTCNTATSRAIYRGRASGISGNSATMVFEKCAGAGSNIDAGRRWWVVVGDSAFPSEGNVPHYVARREGTVGSTTTSLTISNVSIWPSAAAFNSAPCGDTRHIFLITDGGDAPMLRRWYQYRAVTFTKTC